MLTFIYNTYMGKKTRYIRFKEKHGIDKSYIVIDKFIKHYQTKLFIIIIMNFHLNLAENGSTTILSKEIHIYSN